MVSKTDNNRRNYNTTGIGSGADDQAFQLYLKEVSNYEPLSREEEVQISKIIQTYEDGPVRDSARKKLTKANLRFVISVAKEYLSSGFSLPELVSAGNVGLMTATDRFEGTRGYKFISYAVWWIRQSILKSIAEDKKTVRMSLNALTDLRKISIASTDLQRRINREPTIEEIANETDLTQKRIEERLQQGSGSVSIYQGFPDADDDDYTLLDKLESPGPTPEETYEDKQKKENIMLILGSLDEREQRIIRLYFGLNGNGEESMTLEQIGKRLNLTRERIRQLKERALGKLRHPSRYKILQDLIS
jgi:RNA polymerase primary sigma factor